VSRRTKHLREAACLLREGHELSAEQRELLAGVLEGEAGIRDTQPSGFYEAPFDALAIAIITQDF